MGKKTWAISVLVMTLMMQLLAGCTAAPKANEADPQTKVLNAINSIRQKNYYVQVNDSESTYSIQVYNSKGESIVQSDSMEDLRVYRNDSHSIIFSDKVYFGQDIDILKALQNAVSLVGTQSATITETIADGSNGTQAGLSDIELVVTGIDNIKKIYAPIGEEFATNIVAGLTESTGAQELGLKYNIIIGTNDELSIICYIILDGTEYTSWEFDGYIELPSWELNEAWYKDDWTDGDAASQLLNTELSALDNIFHEYAIANGIDTSPESSSNIGSDGDAESASSEPESSTSSSGADSDGVSSDSSSDVSGAAESSSVSSDSSSEVSSAAESSTSSETSSIS